MLEEVTALNTTLKAAQQDSKDSIREIPRVSPVTMKDDKENKGEETLSKPNPVTVDGASVVIADSESPSTSDVATSNAIRDDDLNDASFASAPMSYNNTKKSPFYIKAKAFLQTGDFEAALTTIESGIKTILTLLPEPDEMHESIAPLSYLYGTTLLYSIEESQENPENSMMAAEQQQQQATDDSAGDLQIAWENLETARSIISNFSNNSNDNEKTKMSAEEKEELSMDFAQIHARLGDLSRHDGHFERAINDYDTCCETRRNILQGDRVWDRKIADVEYSLGITCLSLAAEGEKNLLDEIDGEDKNVAGTNASASTASRPSAIKAQSGEEDEKSKVNLSPDQITALREKSVRHYVQSSRILAGMIAVMCDQNPTEIAAADINLENNENKKCAAESVVVDGGKTTGLDENISVNDQASAALSAIRGRVSKLKPNDPEDNAQVHDLREMLDEIQETIDNSEKDREGLRDLGIMRKQAEEEIKKSDEFDKKATEAEPEPEAGTTTIGFGAQNESPIESKSASGSETAATKSTSSLIASTTSARPMMVVKKKKKKRVELKKSEDDTEPGTKRVKT